MKDCDLRRVSCVILVILVLCVGWVTAIRPTSALYDQTGIYTTIDATCIGTFIVDHDMEWHQSSSHGSNLLNKTLTDGETRAIFTYTEDTLGADGETRYTKDFTMDGSNVSQGRDNLDARHTVNFKTEESGALLWDEQATITVDGASSEGTDIGRCVFAGGTADGSAAFSGTVEAGSRMNVQEVAAVTQVNGRAISESSTVPVNLRYGFDAQGLGTTDDNTLAKGSAEVFMNTNFVTGDPATAEDCSTPTNVTTIINDRQRTMASGLFDLAQTHEYISTY
ncbi:MAG: hypothetical protein GXY48_04855 [Methanomicrobiales archaeon]|nr:hypothetical protein [Methanomicrobiales archaeon]